MTEQPEILDDRDHLIGGARYATAVLNLLAYSMGEVHPKDANRQRWEEGADLTIRQIGESAYDGKDRLGIGRDFAGSRGNLQRAIGRPINRFNRNRRRR